MNRKMLSKLTIDLIMTILLFAAMACRITGNTIHELVGVSMFVLFIAHNIVNRRWYQAVLKEKNSVLSVLNTTVNLLILITMAVLLVSAVYISHTVFDFIPAEGNLFVRKIHVFSAYWGFILMSVHLGIHWGMITGAVRRMTGITITNRIYRIVLRVVVVLIVVYGVQVSFDKDLCSKLILYYAYDFWNSDESMTGIFMSYLSIMGIYIFGTYYVLKFVRKYKRAKG